MDLWYVENQSFRLDLKILRLTIAAVISARGVNQSAEVTMERFKGGSS
jgi:sugar transferase EpsL